MSRSARRPLDPQNMFDTVKDLGRQFHAGWITAADIVPRHRATEINHLVVLGMGGSAMGGDLLRAYARKSSNVPVTVVRDYDLPAWVGPRTLVVVSSYSGTTEETLSALEQVVEAGIPHYVISSGGDLLEHAQEDDLPHVILPPGMQPRAALGYSFAALLRIADKVGLVSVDEHEFGEAVETLDSAAETLAGKNSRAREIAHALRDRLTVVYTGSGLLEPVGVRWRNQIQENAKHLAYGNAFAELTHNEIMGWENAPEEIRNQMAMVVLRDPDDHPKIGRRMEITRELLSTRAANWIEHDAAGEWPLTRMLSTLQLGDFVSVFLAFETGVDPTPVETIQQLKRSMAESSEVAES